MDNVTTIARVEHDFEAVSIIAALGDAGINAVKQQASVDNPLSLPGAMGIPENGYDIIVSEDDAANALDILIGMGYGCEDADEPEVQRDGDDSEPIDENEKMASPVMMALGRVLGAILILAGIAVFVWLSDFIIDLVRSLF